MLAQLNSTQRVAGFDDVELVSLVTQDLDRADHFVKQTLGKLAAASPEIRAAVLTFVNEQCNASRAAARLYTHETLCCDGFLGRSNYYRDHSGRTACRLPSRWTCSAGAVAATREASARQRRLTPSSPAPSAPPSERRTARSSRVRRRHHGPERPVARSSPAPASAPCVRPPRGRRAPSRSGMLR